MRAWYLGHPDTKEVVGMVVAKNFTELCEVVGEMSDPIFFLYLEAYRSAAIVSPGLLKCNVTEWCFGPDLDVHRNLDMVNWNKYEPSLV